MRPMSEGIQLLNAVQDVYLMDEVTVANPPAAAYNPPMAALVFARLDSGQVYNIDLPELKVTRDDVDGIYVLHGRGHFQTFETREEAFERKKELTTAPSARRLA